MSMFLLILACRDCVGGWLAGGGGGGGHSVTQDCLDWTLQCLASG